MSIAALPAATTATETTTAEITFDTLGTPYLHVDIDGDRTGFKIDPHMLRLWQRTATAQAERILRRYAGYMITGSWATSENGRLSATVATAS
ncbi:hypothetical protein SAMN04489716_6916 [Actinoplanes derwentensis]|uniref:Uncharacterized protein n=2 Tax=Actinoplanes derwentensis TaxID=113562 RepID=A0A1H2CUU3_9ACTN|nr:hypothetical protein Ade03nite_08910 [Actinoplanes derwentensis]SDT74231.1 hypothetical protein SAMN04489716_6916 [Actinoplanes derwentensis]